MSSPRAWTSLGSRTSRMVFSHPARAAATRTTSRIRIIIIVRFIMRIRRTWSTGIVPEQPLDAIAGDRAIVLALERRSASPSHRGAARGIVLQPSKDRHERARVAVCDDLAAGVLGDDPRALGVA